MGSMRSLLDAPAARLYAEESRRSDGARALDYHRIFFLLNSASLLCASLDGEPHALALRRHWKRPHERLRQCAAMLAQGLSTDSSASRVQKPVAILYITTRRCPMSEWNTIDFKPRARGYDHRRYSLAGTHS